MSAAFRSVLVALDLEMNQPSGAIIQVGLAVGDLQTGACLGMLDVLVRPNEPLAPYIVELCGITDAMLDADGVSLAQAHARMLQFLAPFAATRQLNPLTWGGGDSDTLRRQLGEDGETWTFGRRWIDTKTVYMAWQHAHGRDAKGGLRSSMKQMGLKFEGRAHTAAADAWNTFRMYRTLTQRMAGPKHDVQKPAGDALCAQAAASPSPAGVANG